MTGRLVPRSRDRIDRSEGVAIAITVDGVEMAGEAGQSIAGVLMAAGRQSWRTTSVHAQPRGLFCGIGVCFDCILIVNGERDVRACQRRASDGDVVATQHDELPEIKQ